MGQLLKTEMSWLMKQTHLEVETSQQESGESGSEPEGVDPEDRRALGDPHQGLH